jgi:hypothetical protein
MTIVSEGVKHGLGSLVALGMMLKALSRGLVLAGLGFFSEEMLGLGFFFFKK